MRDVYAIFGTLLAVGIALPGWLFAMWLLLPRRVDKAADNVRRRSRRSFISGLIVALLLAVVVLALASVPLPFAKMVAAAIAISGVAVAGVGAAGIVLHMARRLQTQSRLALAPAFILAAVAFELAAAMPLVGWLLIAPVGLILSLGAVLLPARRQAATVAQPPLSIEL